MSNELDRIKEMAGINEIGGLDRMRGVTVSPLEQACRLGLQSIQNASSLLEALRDGSSSEGGSPPSYVVASINDMLAELEENASIIRGIRKKG